MFKRNVLETVLMALRSKSRFDWLKRADRERLRLSPDEAVPGERTVSIGDALDSVLKDVRMADSHWLNKLRAGWEDVAGDVAKHTRPDRIEGKCLYVAVDSSVWLSELSRHGSKPLLARLRGAGFGGQVSSVRFQIDSER
jgi:predicted nucleic acid-binding Zn ribbon protein